MRGNFIRLFCIIGVCSLFLYGYLDRLNSIAVLRLQIPELTQELKALEEENSRLAFQKEAFKDPIHLMGLMQQPEYSHLHYPFSIDVQTMAKGLALQLEVEEEVKVFPFPTRLGAKN